MLKYARALECVNGHRVEYAVNVEMCAQHIPRAAHSTVTDEALQQKGAAFDTCLPGAIFALHESIQLPNMY